MNDNNVELIGHYGGDKAHCLSAWCSTSSELEIDLPKQVNERVEKLFEETIKTKKNTPAQLLKYLASHKHETPFEKSLLHFQIETDIASHIHLLKHRIGISTNSSSARYKELSDDKFYVPLDWPEKEIKKHVEFCEYCLEEYHRLTKELTKYYIDTGLNKKQARQRAKESSRYKLPYSKQLICDVSFNWRSFMNFVRLRYSTHSQKEIRDIAHKMLKCVINLKEFEHTVTAYELIDEQGNLRKPYE